MAFDPKHWTTKTNEAFAAAIDQAKSLNNPEITPDHVLAALTRQDDTIVPAVLAALDGLRDVGGMSESFPLIVDEAFERLHPDEVPALLEVLMSGAAHQQVIVLTGSEVIENWARLESMTGAISTVELQPTARALPT